MVCKYDKLQGVCGLKLQISKEIFVSRALGHVASPVASHTCTAESLCSFDCIDDIGACDMHQSKGCTFLYSWWEKIVLKMNEMRLSMIGFGDKFYSHFRSRF